MTTENLQYRERLDQFVARILSTTDRATIEDGIRQIVWDNRGAIDRVYFSAGDSPDTLQVRDVIPYDYATPTDSVMAARERFRLKASQITPDGSIVPPE